MTARTRPTVPDVLPMVREYCAMPGNDVGGALHIVLDDANLSDESVDWCAEMPANQLMVG